MYGDVFAPGFIYCVIPFVPCSQDPRITSISPERGPKAGGTLATINGTSLDTGSSVTVTLSAVPCHIERLLSANLPAIS